MQLAQRTWKSLAAVATSLVRKGSFVQKAPATTELPARVFAPSSVLRISAPYQFFQSAMSSKQSTLGYVKPSQTTLSKFFGRPDGSKPAEPQQAKLAFSAKSEKKVKKQDVSEDAPDSSSGKPIDTSTDTAAASSDNGDIVMTNGGEDESLSTPRKRQAAAEDDINGVSDDEPPTKKQRVVSAQKATKSALKTTSKSDSESEAKSESDGSRSRKSVSFDPSAKGEEDDKPSKFRQRNGAKAARQKEIKNEDDEELETKNNGHPVEILTAVKTEGDSAVLVATENDSEQEESEESDEEEKPEVAAKAREKVQSTLSSNNKDPYPDWKPGDPVPYAALCTTFSKVEMTTKRLEISAHCSLFLRQVLRLTPKDLLPTIQLMIGKLAADYSGIELGIGESLIMKAIGETTGRSLAVIKADQNDIGDLGLVAAKSRSNQPTMFKPKPLTIRGVHDGLMAIATTEGQGAQGRKVAGIKKLLSAADAHLSGKGSKGIDVTKDKGGPSEAKFIIRTLEGKMRLGLAEKTVIVAIAHAMVTHEIGQNSNKIPSAEQLAKGEAILKAVFSELPAYEVVVPAMIEHGIFNLHENCRLQAGVPLKPMLAKPTKSITEVLDRFEGKHFSCEYKYDGERAQIHYVAHDSEQEYATEVPSAGKSSKGISNIFSRNSEDLSKKYPDILAKLPSWVKDTTKSFVLDCETVAWDTEEKKVLPFQQLMTRKRKDVKTEDIKVKVCVFAFDILYLNGEALVNKPFRERREALHAAFTPVEGEFAYAKYGDTSELDAIQVLLEDSVKAGCEGLMVKMLDGLESHYEPSRRSQNWLKVKKDYLAGVGDSLDLVVLGAYFGRGKRTAVYGAFLLACYNPSAEVYETVCNIGTGFSEAALEELHEQLADVVIERPKPFYAHSAGNKDQPDVWFEPRFVWEVKTADLTLSPRYKAAAAQLEGVGGGGKGVSLRFPRFLKVREDKKPEEATTSRQVADMYRMQESVAGAKKGGVDDDFDY